MTHGERTAVDEALRSARLELRQARREQRIDDVFARYGDTPHDDAVQRRTHTLAYNTLTTPPGWVVEHLHRLHDNGRLAATRIDELAARIVGAAAHLDRHGHLSSGWEKLGPDRASRPVPVAEVDIPVL